jgi:hypothetical protein
MHGNSSRTATLPASPELDREAEGVVEERVGIRFRQSGCIIAPMTTRGRFAGMLPLLLVACTSGSHPPPAGEGTGPVDAGLADLDASAAPTNGCLIAVREMSASNADLPVTAFRARTDGAGALCSRALCSLVLYPETPLVQLGRLFRLTISSVPTGTEPRPLVDPPIVTAGPNSVTYESSLVSRAANGAAGVWFAAGSITITGEGRSFNVSGAGLALTPSLKASGDNPATGGFTIDLTCRFESLLPP